MDTVKLANNDKASCAASPIRLEDSPLYPGLPSPFTHMALQTQLSHTMSMKIREVDSPFSPEQVLAYEREVEDWLSSFPPAYSITEPDTSWDKEHPYIVLQRRQLHATAYMIKLDLLKPYIIKRVNGITPEIDQAFQSIGVDCCLKLMEASQRIFDLIFPITAKFHLVIFCVFDTAAILCSALIHDKARSLPQRHQVVQAIETALTMLEQFSLITKIGAMSYKIISTLVAALPLSSQERHVLSIIPPLRQPEHPKSAPFRHHGRFRQLLRQHQQQH
jgi:hypothetical protein